MIDYTLELERAAVNTTAENLSPHQQEQILGLFVGDWRVKNYRTWVKLCRDGLIRNRAIETGHNYRGWSNDDGDELTPLGVMVAIALCDPRRAWWCWYRLEVAHENKRRSILAQAVRS